MSLFLLTGERGVFVTHNISKNQYLTFSTFWPKSSDKGFHVGVNIFYGSTEYKESLVQLPFSKNPIHKKIEITEV